MEIDRIEPARRFTAGRNRVELRHVADVRLEHDEIVTFRTEDGGEYDVARKSWGFYATPSVNSRLPAQGLRAALVEGEDGKRFVLLKEDGRDAEFERYLAEEGMRVRTWLDD